MVKESKTPRGKRGQRAKSPTLEKHKSTKVSKPKKKTTVKGTPLKIQKHGMKTRARAAEVYDQCDRYQRNRASSSPSSPRTPPLTEQTKPGPKTSLWHALSTSRSFWDAVKDAANEAASSRQSSYDNTNINHIMSRLSNSISSQFDSYKYEDYGFLSPSSPSGHDPREVKPVTDEEVEELQTAIWPTMQHVLELTKSYIHLPDSKDSYLDQIRHVRYQLRNTWENQCHAGNVPSPFQLEAWRCGVSNWRSSTYTNGEDRFSASLVATQIEVWRAELPSPTTPHDTTTIDDDDGISSGEIFHAGHEWNNNNMSPTPNHGSNRRPMSAIYRDISIHPPPEAGTTTPPSLPTPTSIFFPSRRSHHAVPIIFEDQATPPPPPPPPSSDDHHVSHTPNNMEYDDAATASSDKENDRDLAMRAEQRRRRRRRTARARTLSSSRDAMEPVGERCG